MSRVGAMFSLQGYLAHKTPPPPKDPTGGLCPGTYGDPRGVGVSYERGTPLLIVEEFVCGDRVRQVVLAQLFAVWRLGVKV